jgi:DNA-binding MarR family transcriptional regulator
MKQLAQTPDDDRCVVAGHLIPKGTEGRTALLLARIGGVLGDVADDRLGAAGVDGREYSILAILATDGPGTQQDLALMVGKAPGVIVAAIDALEARGLVARTRDPEDRRRSRVTLTAKGARTLKRADAVAEDTVGEVLPGLSAAQRQQLGELLAVGVGLAPEVAGARS